MRTNTREVLQAVQNGKALRKADSVWTDGLHIYSYATCILAQQRDGTFVLNVTKYSNTTSDKQSSIRAWGPIRAGLSIVAQVDGMPRGCSPERLLDAGIKVGS
jgi:hypothetical protein